MDIHTMITWLETPDNTKTPADFPAFCRLAEELGNPQNSLKFVHIAGTNGKGSTSAMLASKLGKSGYKAGLYPSPHLVTYRERSRVDGKLISEPLLSAALARVKEAADKLPYAYTMFQKLTAAAFLYFRAAGCDIVVLEVGMGGRFDPTNVIPAPEAAVIVNIGVEHVAVLGKTLTEIAGHKAGIIKPGADVILYHQTEEVEQVIRAEAKAQGCPVTVTAPDEAFVEEIGLEGQTVSYRSREHIRLGLTGTYQAKNLQTVLDTADVLAKRGWKISEENIREGLARVDWHGRFDILQKEPLIFVDGAHNPNGVTELEESISRYFPDQKLIFLFSVMKDKDKAAILDMMVPHAGLIVAVRSNSPRAIPADELAAYIREHYDVPVHAEATVEEGLAYALKQQKAEDTLGIFGCLYMAGQILQKFGVMED